MDEKAWYIWVIKAGRVYVVRWFITEIWQLMDGLRSDSPLAGASFSLTVCWSWSGVGLVSSSVDWEVLHTPDRDIQNSTARWGYYYSNHFRLHSGPLGVDDRVITIREKYLLISSLRNQFRPIGFSRTEDSSRACRGGGSVMMSVWHFIHSVTIDKCRSVGSSHNNFRTYHCQQSLQSWTMDD